MLEGRRIGAIIAAGGSGSRMGSSIPKQFLSIGQKPILYHSTAAFQLNWLDELVVVVNDEYLDLAKGMLKDLNSPPAFILKGGQSRQESVKNGLNALNTDIVIIHDGARPFVTNEQILDCTKKAIETGAAIVACPCFETVKTIENGSVSGTLNRDELALAQTPQAFWRELLERAYIEAGNFVATDEAGLVEKLGIRPALVTGSRENIKITTPEDLRLAECIVAMRNNM